MAKGQNRRGPGAVTSLICRFEGCTELRHVYPGGQKSTYCKKHMRLRRVRTRNGLPSMSGPMLAVLEYLYKMKKWERIPYNALDYPVVDNRTITALLDRRWIRQSDMPNDRSYIITHYGEEALRVYKPAINRKDGICPACNERPRYTTSGGRVNSYCRECERERSRRKLHRLINDGSYHPLCYRCKQQPRRQYSTGTFSKYCADCERDYSKAKLRREQDRLLASIRNGAPPPPCVVCKSRPRRVFVNSVSDYCAECAPKMSRKYKLRRAARKHSEVIG